jgi:hypothetical protein
MRHVGLHAVLLSLSLSALGALAGCESFSSDPGTGDAGTIDDDVQVGRDGGSDAAGPQDARDGGGARPSHTCNGTEATGFTGFSLGNDKQGIGKMPLVSGNSLTTGLLGAISADGGAITGSSTATAGLARTGSYEFVFAFKASGAPAEYLKIAEVYSSTDNYASVQILNGAWNLVPTGRPAQAQALSTSGDDLLHHARVRVTTGLVFAKVDNGPEVSVELQMPRSTLQIGPVLNSKAFSAVDIALTDLSIRTCP